MVIQVGDNMDDLTVSIETYDACPISKAACTTLAIFMDKSLLNNAHFSLRAISKLSANFARSRLATPRIQQGSSPLYATGLHGMGMRILDFIF